MLLQSTLSIRLAMQLELNGLSIEIIRKPVKNMYLRILPPDGKVVTTVPMKLPLQSIRSYLEKKQAWIRAKSEELSRRPKKQALLFQTGEKHNFLGESCSLLVYENTGPLKIRLMDNTLHLFVPTKTSLVEKKSLMSNWYKQQMQEKVRELLPKWEPVIGVKVDSFTLKRMKTRWGSCSIRRKHICLNLVLIQKPLACLVYVLVHEMVHLLEPSHNKRFYELMTKFIPDWKECHRQLSILTGDT